MKKTDDGTNGMSLITRAAKKLISAIQEVLPFIRIRHVLGLYPAHDIFPSAESRSHWQSAGIDPQFLLIPAEFGYPTGWVWLRFTMKLQGVDPKAKLYFDHGSGITEEHAIRVPVSKKGTVNFIVHLKPGIRLMRLDPMECPGTIELDGAVCYEISRIEKTIRMLMRVSKFISRYEWTADGRPYRWTHALRDIRGYYEDISYKRAYHPAPQFSYHDWLVKYDILTPEMRSRAIGEVAAMKTKPLISIVMPVYNTPEVFLRKAIDSVCAQIYPAWELCIADDASTKQHVKEILQEYLKKDSRIKVMFRTENGHISEASNSALQLASGEFIALMDHDDVLPEKALYKVAAVLNSRPDIDIVYSDEDKINELDQRFAPHFKSDWNQEMFYSNNFLSHLGVYRTTLIDAAGGFRKGFEGSQDYDLALRCLQHTTSAKIYHIPEILYHWRAISGSTALGTTEKNYVSEAGLNALKDYFARRDPAVEVDHGLWPLTYRVKHPVPRPQPKVSLIIPTRDGYNLLRTCVESILSRTSYDNFEILIMDNQSTDEELLEYFRKLKGNSRVRVIPYDYPFNYSAINNHGASLAKGSIIGLLNNDIEVISEQWLHEMVSYAVRMDVGAVGAKLLYPDDTIQHAGVIIGLGGVAGHPHRLLDRKSPGYFCRTLVHQELSAVTGACLLTRREVFEEMRGLEEKLQVAFNDVDFCLRLRKAGYRIIWTPYALLYHHESASRGNDDTEEKRKRFEQEIQFMKDRWGAALLSDPYYNPNLTQNSTDFSLRN